MNGKAFDLVASGSRSVRLRQFLARHFNLNRAILYTVATLSLFRAESSRSMLTLDQFLALNDEVAALVRAGVPLERGLADIGPDLPRQLRAAAQRLTKRLNSGVDFATALADPQLGIPSSYRAVVDAGLRSGNLAAALQDVATTARRAAQLRRSVGMALAYPLFIAFMAYGLLVGCFIFLMPRVADLHEDTIGAGPSIARTFATLGEYAVYWAPWLPLVTLLAVGVWWSRTGLAQQFNVEPSDSRLARLSPRRAVALSRMATLAEMLAMLVEHHVPLVDALPLAAEATGRKDWIAGSRQIAERLRAGERLSSELVASAGFPTVIGWLLTVGGDGVAMSFGLRRTAEHYREQALTSIRTIETVLPALLTVVVAGGAVITYALMVLAPWYSLLNQLGAP